MKLEGTNKEHRAKIEKGIHYHYQRPTFWCAGCCKWFDSAEDMLTVHVDMPRIGERFYCDLYYLEVELCVECVRTWRPHISWGGHFCHNCSLGILLTTGNERPIKDGEGVWIEYECDRCGHREEEPWIRGEAN